ncbi:HAD family hydrolase [Marinoscillum furvescens]|uniref:Phosphatidylglycerophosphatase C n=1 Tax=Marinoscillum furvescens DSM 4134 TaxID=1122208 RepID=A0A3D9L0U5_MARFU|nr:HAD family hydrolase [Marinoscillum furvescens]RED97076.1 phosphatidylglycerophosphatase C [Marinoscillum furvescens DSM 4134]
MKKPLALFDFDGTITTQDSLAALICYVHGKHKYRSGLMYLAPAIGMTLTGLWSRQKGKEEVLKYFFGGMSVSEFEGYCSRFVTDELPAILRPKALSCLSKHQAAGHRVVVVSASPSRWVALWGHAMGLEVIATELEVNKGQITGRIEGQNCQGLEKVTRIRQQLCLSDHRPIYAYGDTEGDLPMLELANFCYYRPFRRKAADTFLTI